MSSTKGNCGSEIESLSHLKVDVKQHNKLPIEKIGKDSFLGNFRWVSAESYVRHRDVTIVFIHAGIQAEPALQPATGIFNNRPLFG